MVGYHGIQFQEDGIELKVHGGLGCGQAELSGSEFDNDNLETVQVDGGRFDCHHWRAAGWTN